MSFNAKFYTFSKKINSTKRPSGGTSYSIILKAPSGVLDPVIQLDIGQDGNPSAYNYCYIQEFDRYYWVSNWKWENRLWTAECKVDSMASWKDSIGSSTEYVIRATSARNMSIMDGLYPMTTVRAINKVDITSPFTDNIANGMFIIGILGYDNSGVGATEYWALSNANMRGLCYRLLSDINYMNLDFTEISEQLSRAIINPMQYLVSCIWVPFQISNLGEVNTIKVGWWEIAGSAGHRLSQSELTWTYSYSIGSLPKHPSNETYKFMAPYTKYYLDFAPFGYIDIDPSDFVYSNSMVFDITVDLISGLGTLRIQDTAGNNNPVYGLYTSQVGVPMTLSANTQNILSAGIAATQIGVGILTGGTAGAIIGSGAIGNVADFIIPKVQTLGSNGGIGLYKAPPKLTCIFRYTTPEDPVHNGYPYMQSRTINTLSGYILCDNADPDIACTDTELREIVGYMNSGFYYE